MKLGDNHKLVPTHAWEFGPPDPPEDGRVHRCEGCGVEYAAGSYLVAHSFEPCRGQR